MSHLAELGHPTCTQKVAAYRGTQEEHAVICRSFCGNPQLDDLKDYFHLFKKPSNRRKTPAMGVEGEIRKLLHHFIHSFCG
jgi:hypothetical protein